MRVGLPGMALVASYRGQERPELVCFLFVTTQYPLLWHIAVRSLYHMPMSHAMLAGIQNYEPKTSIFNE